MGKKDAGEEKRNNMAYLDEYFKKYINDLGYWLPEGILNVDIDLLQKLDLLNPEHQQKQSLTRYFQVVESLDKITLVNQDFTVWIVPESQGKGNRTYVLIAINKNGIPNLELAFQTTDVYNSSKLVLRILESLLFEIQENEETLKKIGKN